MMLARPFRTPLALLLTLAGCAAAPDGTPEDGAGPQTTGDPGGGSSGADAPGSEDESGAQTSGDPPAGTSGGADETTTAGDDPPQPPSSCTDQACAFPGAEGFGSGTPGGRGGQILEVTTLDADGPGSFTEAMLTAGPRIIVFRVSGVIDMAGASIELQEEHSFVTVAGQTSPGGITLLNGTISAYQTDFHDAVFRFLRLRGPNAYDNISLNGSHHFVIDHCDFSGGTDETFDVTNAHDYTVQWSTVTNSVSGEGSQNYGLLLAYKPTSNITLHHNLSAHHAGRCGAQFHWAGNGPGPEGGAALDIRNNVFYNCAFQQIYRADEAPEDGLRFNLVGNTAVGGPNTPPESMFFGISGELFLDDNAYEGQSILTPYFDGTLLEQSHDFPPVTTSSAAQAYDDVLARVGAWPRDPMIARTVSEVQTLGGTLGQVSDPMLEDGPPPPDDTDHDGMPDPWEEEHGLDPNDPADGAELTPSGYTQVELYLAERAAALIGTG